MKYALRLAWKDMRGRLFASAIMMAQLFIIGMLLIWLAASIPSVFLSLISYYTEEIGKKDVIFVDAGINRNTAAFNNSMIIIEELCDQKKTACSVFDLGNDWMLIVGATKLTGHIYWDTLSESENISTPFILLGSNIKAPDGNCMHWPDSIIRTSNVGLHRPQLVTEIPVAGRLKQGSYCLTKSGNYILDNRMVLCMSFRQYCLLNGNLDFFMTKLQLHSMNATQVADLTNLLLREPDIQWFRPLSIHEHRNKMMSSVWGSMYFIFFVIVFYILMISGMIFYFMQLIQTNQREYAIHRICGATLSDIKRRMLCFIIYIVLPPTSFLTLSVYMMNLSGVPQTPSPFYILALAALTIVMVYILPAKQMEHQDIAGFARPD